MREFLWFYGLPLATGLAGFCFYKGLCKSKEFGWLWVGAGGMLLAGICRGLFQLASMGYLGPVGAFLIGCFCACVALLASGWLAWALKGWRKGAAFALGVLFPLSMWVSIEAGEAISPESITRRNADLIVRTLERYQTGVGQYPSELAALTPGWLPQLPEALTTQNTGWLYVSSGADFTLGYWYWPDKFGSIVCLYTPNAPEWECEHNHWDPFQAVPTPTPCRNPQGEWVDSTDCP